MNKNEAHMTDRHLCAAPRCRGTTKRLLCWSCWQDMPQHLRSQGEEAIKAWAKNKQPVLRSPPARPFNEIAEKP